MKKFLKFSSYFVLAAFFAVALSGCGKATTTATNTNLVVWSFEDADAWKSIKKDFEQKNKGYTLTYQKQTLDSNYENNVLNSILSGQGPDVWSMPNDWVYRHKDKLTAMPATMSETFNIDSFVPAIKESVSINDSIYALSPSAEPLMIYYNPKLFSATNNDIQENSKDKDLKKLAGKLLQEPPALWTDLVQAANLLTQKDASGNIAVSGLAMGTSVITNSTDILYLLMLQNGTNIISSDGKLTTFNLPKNTSTGISDIPGKKALEFYTSFSNPASANYTWSDSMGNDVEAFATGKVAMIFGYSGLQNTLLQRYPSVTYKRAYAPQVNGDVDKIVDFARFNAFGVSKLSNFQNLSWNLVSSLSSDFANEFNSYTRVYSSIKATNYEITLPNRNGSNPEKLSLATAQSLVKGRYPYDFDKNLKEAMDLLNAKKQDSQSALDLAASKSTDLLRKESW